MTTSPMNDNNFINLDGLKTNNPKKKKPWKQRVQNGHNKYSMYTTFFKTTTILVNDVI